MAVFPVLVVCEGNLCRSPFAERVLRSRLATGGAGDRFAVSSAGTRPPVGAEMDPRSARALTERGVDASGFAARRITAPLVDDAGLVLAATRDLRAQVLEESPGALQRTFTMLEFAALAPLAPPGSSPGELVAWCFTQRSTLRDTRRRDADYDVVDPVRESAALFDGVVEQLDDACAVIAQRLVQAAP